jgi:eukaryotic-like serine/threonine-protein kinase
MALTSGTKLGPYEVLSPLGAGGMGEVYRARDTRLGRDVAIKVLPEHLSNPDLKARFEREAKAISSLGHPHICTLHDVGHQDGTDFLVMEFLEGETLAERLQKGAMPFPRHLACWGRDRGSTGGGAPARHCASRSEAGQHHAHQVGRKADGLWPGQASRHSERDGSVWKRPVIHSGGHTEQSEPVSPLTTAGSIVGTIQYMSPEQIEGKEADARSDIFAFGTVLYEMAAGKRPFVGKSQLSLASSILESDPQSIGTIKPSIPPAFVDLVTSCLRKNPEERFQSAHDIRLQLESIAAEPAIPSPSLLLLPARKRERIAWAAVLVAAVILSVLGTIFYRPAEKLTTVRTVLDPPGKTSFALTGDAAGPPVLSPDGTLLAFTATGQDGKTSLWVRPMNSSETRALPDTEGAIFPFWSPDGKAIGFFADGKLKSVDLSGGSALAICDAQLGRGGTWGPNGVILFSANPSSPIMRVSATGGTPAAITRIDTTQHTSHRWPFFLPDGMPPSTTMRRRRQTTRSTTPHSMVAKTACCFGRNPMPFTPQDLCCSLAATNWWPRPSILPEESSSENHRWWPRA